ncbi:MULTISPECIES: hypothetical protein [Enterobacter]|uniref:hypothetical protein n=1 Tax=Enterobacter TaxID=547 RepID=UPI001F26F4CC|nr:hypothetical protein [Enterobacter quasiroggenkampii]
MSKSTLTIMLPQEFQDHQYTERLDVVALHKQQLHAQLNNVAICKDEYGKVITTFGDLSWDCSRMVTTKNSSHRKIDFSEFQQYPDLLYELKLICYGWMFTRNLQYSSPTKMSTIIGRISGLKMSYRFLAEHSLSSIHELQDTLHWAKFLSFLEEQRKSAGTLTHILCAVQQARRLFPWLGYENIATTFSPISLSKKLCRPEATEREQTLAIPERLADTLLQHAVKMVETAWPYRARLSKTECLLQENYEAGEAAVNEKIRTGVWKWLDKDNGSAEFRHHFSKEAIYLAPRKAADIIAQQLSGYPDCPDRANGIWWYKYRSNILTACFVCCAAFSGMRESELFELTPDSYFSATYNRRTFHFLKAKTHKMGEKNTEWVVAPIVQKVISLVAALTEHLRTHILAHATTEREKALAHSLWLSLGRRSSKPKRIANWTLRLADYSRLVGLRITQEDYEQCVRDNPNSYERIKRNVLIGKYWKLSPHQFRRTLAFFTIKNRLGNAIAIKQQFKHLYLQMSEWYCEGGIPSRLHDIEIDVEFQKMIDVTGYEQITHKYWSWFNGKGILSGSHGKDIMKMRDDLPLVYRSWESLLKQVKEKRLTLHGTLHAYCKNGYDCDMGGVVNPAFCVDCGSHGSIIDEEQAKWWKNKHATLTRYLTDNPAASVAELTHCMTQIRAAEKVMSDFSVEFYAFQPGPGFKTYDQE